MYESFLHLLWSAIKYYASRKKRTHEDGACQTSLWSIKAKQNGSITKLLLQHEFVFHLLSEYVKVKVKY